MAGKLACKGVLTFPSFTTMRACSLEMEGIWMRTSISSRLSRGASEGAPGASGREGTRTARW